MEPVFVFGSNLSGRHGAGAALTALRHHRASYGVGAGIQGDSYAIPTKDSRLVTLPLSDIEGHVNRFIEFARQHSFLTFKVTQIGCGLAGYFPYQIAPMFKEAPDNCLFDTAWSSFLPDTVRYFN